MGTYGRLGDGAWPVALCLGLLVLGPPGLVAALCWGRRLDGSPRLAIALVSCASLATVYWLARHSVRLRVVPAVQALDLSSTEAPIKAAVRRASRRRSAPKGTTWETAGPATCKRNLAEVEVTALVGYVSRLVSPPAPVVQCLQGNTVKQVVRRLVHTVGGRAARGPVKLDWVVAHRRVGAAAEWLDPVKLRPGLDGVCDGSRCLAPWQLTVRDAFSRWRPWLVVPDFQFGVSVSELRSLLEAPGRRFAGLTRFSTRSLVIGARGRSVTPLRRLHPQQPDSAAALSAPQLSRAERAAERYLLRAQLDSGRFRYGLSPFTGQSDERSFSLARQAGAAMALCELGSKRAAVERAIDRALAVLWEYRVQSGSPHLLQHSSATRSRLGEQALPLVALMSCRARGHSVGALPAELARFVLQQQRADGSFFPAWHEQRTQPEGAGEPLYATGQALLGLVLVEQALGDGPIAGFPEREEVRRAVQRGFDHYAHRYFRHPLRDFFFIEENWHCLAARAALSVHRHPAYERFCLDYLRFKSRLILRRDKGAAPGFDGGFGFSNLVPPHNTGAFGFAEALAAGLEIVASAGQQEDRLAALQTQWSDLLRRVLAFTVRQQWNRTSGFALATPSARGGFSEHLHSSAMRVDYTQHAWSALGHGRRVLRRIGALSTQ